MSLHDDRLIRVYLSNMPLGKYHLKDNDPLSLYRDGKPVLYAGSEDPDLCAEGLFGCLAALVHLLNTREQTPIEPKE